MKAIDFLKLAGCVLLVSCGHVKYTNVVDQRMEASQNHFELVPGGVRGLVWMQPSIHPNLQNDDAARERIRSKGGEEYSERYIREKWGRPDKEYSKAGLQCLVYEGVDPESGAGLKTHLSHDRPIVLGYKNGRLGFVSAFFPSGRPPVPDVDKWVVP